jgi:hypothetical protein
VIEQEQYAVKRGHNTPAARCASVMANWPTRALLKRLIYNAGWPAARCDFLVKDAGTRSWETPMAKSH